MRDIAQNVVIQIEVTNACHLSCQGCTRHVGHHRKPFFMDLETIKRAIDSLDGWGGRIGCMGGEPTLHPEFEQICRIFQDMVPIERREFWTAGFRWGNLKPLIDETFPLRHYNDHVAYDGMHKPLLIAIDEVVDDPEFRRELIDNCPYQTHWSASITPKGCFPCEIAASMDWLFDGPGGWPIERGWWQKTVADYDWMIERYCGKCSGALPMPARSDGRGGRDGATMDLVSPGNVERLRAIGSKKIARGHYEVFEGKITREDIAKHTHLNPREYRKFIAHSPEDVAAALASRTIGVDAHAGQTERGS
jgi:hypothetical protein